MAINSVQTNPQAIYDFAKELDNYITQLLQGINGLESEHSMMGEYWRDAQYNEMTEIVSDFKYEVGKIKNELDILIDETKKKANELAAVQGVSLRK